jgi:hypothetical protein
VVNERDELGSNLVPDYLTSVREGALPRGPRKTASDARPKIVNARNAQHPNFGRLPKIAADLVARHEGLRGNSIDPTPR